MNKDRDEDSGLHDIRSLASSTKARLSSRRSTQSPIMNEDDILASSSAGWKAVALPEPAKMVSLPELASCRARRRSRRSTGPRARRRRRRPRRRRPRRSAAMAAAVAVDAAAPAVEAPRRRCRSARGSIANQGATAAQGQGHDRSLVGVGLAAAAGAAMFFAMDKKQDEPAAGLALRVEADGAAGDDREGAARHRPRSPRSRRRRRSRSSPWSRPRSPWASRSTSRPPGRARAMAPSPRSTRSRSATRWSRSPKPVEKVAPPPKDEKPKGDGEGEPSFDALLKEAGVTDQKKDAKPKLDKKSLSGGDIKKGMGCDRGQGPGLLHGHAGHGGGQAHRRAVRPGPEGRRSPARSPARPSPRASRPPSRPRRSRRGTAARRASATATCCPSRRHVPPLVGGPRDPV